MFLCFVKKGVNVHFGEAETVPPPGSRLIFRMREEVKGHAAGTLVSAVVSTDRPAIYDYVTIAPKLLVTLEVLNIAVALE